VPYHLKAIPEVQQYLNVAFERARQHGDLQDLYRRRYVVISDLCMSSANARASVCWWSLDSLQMPYLRRALMICDSCSIGQQGRHRPISSPLSIMVAFVLIFHLLPLFFVFISRVVFSLFSLGAYCPDSTFMIDFLQCFHAVLYNEYFLPYLLMFPVSCALTFFLSTLTLPQGPSLYDIFDHDRVLSAM